MKQIFIISKHAMFSHGLESLLRKEGDFQIVAREEDISGAIEQIEALQPDVVILDSDDVLTDTLPHFQRILVTTPTLKIVGLSLQNNDVHVYQIDRWVVQAVGDLVEAIDKPNPTA
jgi:DNA-binding NarL/FixJ family response regulator